VDRNKRISIYNRRAREIFGIAHHVGPSHPEGKIAPGDIVVLADNCLSADDGGLKQEDLSLIGIPPLAVNPGDALVAVGRYKAPYEAPYYKTAVGGHLQTPLTLSCCINKRNRVEVVIDDFAKNVSMIVDDISYDMGYQISIGHMVILDGETGEIKFYQSRGYTARGEDLRHILTGKVYPPFSLGVYAFPLHTISSLENVHS
jgi:hypothetical protein